MASKNIILRVYLSKNIHHSSVIKTHNLTIMLMFSQVCSQTQLLIEKIKENEVLWTGVCRNSYEQWDVKPNLVSICSWSSRLFTPERRPIINQAVTLSLRLWGREPQAVGSTYLVNSFNVTHFPPSLPLRASSSLCNSANGYTFQNGISFATNIFKHAHFAIRVFHFANVCRAAFALWADWMWQIHHVRTQCHCLLVLHGSPKHTRRLWYFSEGDESSHGHGWLKTWIWTS